jgi:hypothetical protein
MIFFNTLFSNIVNLRTILLHTYTLPAVETVMIRKNSQIITTAFTNIPKGIKESYTIKFTIQESRDLTIRTYGATPYTTRRNIILYEYLWHADRHDAANAGISGTIRCGCAKNLEKKIKVENKILKAQTLVVCREEWISDCIPQGFTIPAAILSILAKWGNGTTGGQVTKPRS